MNGDIVLTAPGMKITLRRRTYSNCIDTKDRAQLRNRDTHVYISPSGESLFENLTNRRQRPYTIWRKEVLPKVRAAILRETGLLMSSRASWSQGLGCRCGCSPGFKTLIQDDLGNHLPYTVWVTVTEI